MYKLPHARMFPAATTRSMSTRWVVNGRFFSTWTDSLRRITSTETVLQALVGGMRARRTCATVDAIAEHGAQTSSTMITWVTTSSGGSLRRRLSMRAMTVPQAVSTADWDPYVPINHVAVRARDPYTPTGRSPPVASWKTYRNSRSYRTAG